MLQLLFVVSAFQKVYNNDSVLAAIDIVCRTWNGVKLQGGPETVCCSSVRAEVLLAPVDFLSADLQKALRLRQHLH